MAIRLRGDLERLSEKRQVIDVDGPQIELKRFRDRAHVHALALGLDAIDVGKDLRGARPEEREHAVQLWAGGRLRDRALQAFSRRVWSAASAILDHQLYPSGGAQSPN